MIEYVAHMTGESEDDARKMITSVVLFVASLILALLLLAGWVALVIYGIVPFSLDGGGEVKVIRVMLVLGGGFAIVAAYVIGLMAATS